MSAHSQITILQYNMHISKDKVMAPFFRDRTNDNYSVIAVQEPWINSHNPELITTHHSNTAHYELFFPTGANPHTCFFINKEIPVQNWTIVQHSPDLISLWDCDVLHLHMVQSGNLFIFGLNRARRGQLEHCRRIVTIITPVHIRHQGSVASTNRGLPANWV